jgi:hypothetical protein
MQRLVRVELFICEIYVCIDSKAPSFYNNNNNNNNNALTKRWSEGAWV